ncbi:MAG: polyprenol monophosphomannose synthase [Candidatus Hydrogenedentota bacterium]|nr:MAG: polyprenol monophosphomannose synthase [Candidatus Hydrogenedentota bacterium]
MIPTYNERENIFRLIPAILGLEEEIHILIVDDNSPDGTADVVKEFIEKSERVHLVLRTKKRGRGSAGVAGFRRALDLGAEIVIEMDADFSHPVRYLPVLIEALEDVDVVLASRLVRGGGEVNRSLKRILITKGANLLTRTVMGYPVHDCTAGYRVFRRRVLEAIELETLSAEGPAIVGEVLYRVVRGGFRLREVPYIYEDRQFGRSTLTTSTLLNCLWWLLKLKARQMMRDAAAFRKARDFYSSHPPEPASDPWRPKKTGKYENNAKDL